MPVGSLSKRAEQLRREGGSVPVGSVCHAGVLAPAPFSESFFQLIIVREIGSCPDGGALPSHSWVFVALALFSTLAEQNMERKKKKKIPPKSAPTASFANPVTGKQLAGAAAAPKPVSLGESIWEFKKKSPVAYML